MKPKQVGMEMGMEMTDTKKDLILKVVKLTGLTQLECEAAIDAFMLSIIDSLKAGHRIELRNWGIYQVVVKNSYTGRNPKTGKSIVVPTKLNPIFKFSNEMKRLFREGQNGEK